MYRVTVKTNGVEYLLHEPRDEEIQLINPELTEEVGKNGTFKFTIPPLHPNKDKIIPMASDIMLYEDNEMFFCCRMLDSESDFYNTGKATCEGELAYILDSVQRPYEYTGGMQDYFKQLLNIHNSQVEERKRFELGIITVSEEQITRSNANYSSTMNEMLSQLVDKNGGYLHVRYDDGKKYLDYVMDYGGINSQVIRFGENLLDMTMHVDPMNLITALIPLGATVPNDTNEVEKPLTIVSVNDGKDYIYNQAGVDKFGWIFGTKTFDDVTDSEVLKVKGQAALDESVMIPDSLQLKAIDLSLVDVDTQKLRIGYWTDTISKPHGLNKRLLLSRKVTNLADPARNSIVLGQTIKTFTGEAAKKEAQTTARINAVASNASKEINRKVENATQLITGGKGGYVVLDVEDPDTGERELPWRILIMDTPDKDTATSVIQLNKNGIGFSTTGINGPYSNAWTIDGNLVADFITTGTMLADRIRGGVLEVGGRDLGKDGSIVVKNASGTVIGQWDKSGLHVKLGIIEGTTINGSIINGTTINSATILSGAINIGGGVFSVGGDGKTIIMSGKVGAFVVTNENYGIFASANGEIQLSTSEWDGTGPSLDFTKSGSDLKTRIGYGGINTNSTIDCSDMYLTGDDNFWSGWTLTQEIKYLHNKVFGTSY